jgi:hypothetical protein
MQKEWHTATKLLTLQESSPHYDKELNIYSLFRYFVALVTRKS